MPTARQVNWAKFRVFNVAALALMILSVIFYLLSGGTILEQKTSLYLYIPDATGLASGSPVRVDGIDVGKVNTVVLSGLTQPDRIVRVSMTVEREWLRSIPSDSWAQLTADTLIGDKFVDITSGASRIPVAPNGTIVYRENPDIMKRLDLSQFRKQIDQVNAVLTDLEQGRGLLGEFLQGSGMYEEWRKLLRETQTAMNAMTARTGRVGSEVYSDRTYQQFRQTLLDFDQSLARLQSGQGQGGALLRDEAQYQQVAAVLTDLRQSLAQIGASPWLQSDADYRNWSGRLAGLVRTVDAFNASPPMATSDAYDSLAGMAGEIRNSLMDFRLHPTKFMRMKIF